jgi:hypothetical protein
LQLSSLYLLKEMVIFLTFLKNFKFLSMRLFEKLSHTQKYNNSGF